MAFFTRVNTNVPFLPSEDSLDSSTLKRGAEEAEQCTEDGEKVSENEKGRYEYVVDRVLGVEV